MHAVKQVFVLAADQGLQERASAIAERDGLTLWQSDSAAAGVPSDAYLWLTADGLELRGPDGDGSLLVDLTGGRLGWRLRHGGGRAQAIARAVGLRSGRPAPRVLDATAGLGRDSAVLATLGCEVLAVERHPAIHALLEDALLRAGDQYADRLRLVHADSTELLRDPTALATAGGTPEVVLVDPMHPPRRKSALPKLEMRLFRTLLGEDPDQAELLLAALQSGARRVVVKRPADRPPLAPAGPLAGIEPHHSVDGRTTRFDVYLRLPPGGSAVAAPQNG